MLRIQVLWDVVLCLRVSVPSTFRKKIIPPSTRFEGPKKDTSPRHRSHESSVMKCYKRCDSANSHLICRKIQGDAAQRPRPVLQVAEEAHPHVHDDNQRHREVQHAERTAKRFRCLHIILQRQNLQRSSNSIH